MTAGPPPLPRRPQVRSAATARPRPAAPPAVRPQASPAARPASAGHPADPWERFSSQTAGQLREDTSAGLSGSGGGAGAEKSSPGMWLAVGAGALVLGLTVFMLMNFHRLFDTWSDPVSREEYTLLLMLDGVEESLQFSDKQKRNWAILRSQQSLAAVGMAMASLAFNPAQIKALAEANSQGRGYELLCDQPGWQEHCRQFGPRAQTILTPQQRQQLAKMLTQTRDPHSCAATAENLRQEFEANSAGDLHENTPQQPTP